MQNVKIEPWHAERVLKVHFSFDHYNVHTLPFTGQRALSSLPEAGSDRLNVQVNREGLGLTSLVHIFLKHTLGLLQLNNICENEQIYSRLQYN